MDKSDLIKELLYSYYDARKNKRNTYNQLSFELKYEKNIISLADQILEKKYTPKPSICFIVDKPVKREIFAADFWR